MNDTPRVNWQGRVGLVTNYGCGRIAEDNRARAFWQSRAGLREPPQLVSLEDLSRKMRVGQVELPAEYPRKGVSL